MGLLSRKAERGASGVPGHLGGCSHLRGWERLSSRRQNRKFEDFMIQHFAMFFCLGFLSFPNHFGSSSA